MTTTTALPVVSLSNVKYSAFASEETACYEANILIDGKKVGSVSNAGKGGGDDIHPWALEKQLADIAKAMPKFYPDLENCAELLLGNLLDTHLLGKDLKRALGKRLLFTKADGKVYQSATMEKAVLAQAVAAGEVRLKARLNGAVDVLNLLPYEKALELYRAATKKQIA
jgi:hypothetical protein